MTEQLMQHIWKYRFFNPTGMQTTEGQRVDILNPGRLNTDSGPDFFNAQVRIDNLTWVGNIELHLDGDDWFSHHHQNDAAYNNVVLHVVLHPSTHRVLTKSRRVVPEVVLNYSPIVERKTLQIMQNLKNEADIRCAARLKTLSSLDRVSLLDRMLFERFEERQQRVDQYMAATNNNGEQVMFILLARALGQSVNADAMEHLARITPVRLLTWYSDPLRCEALLFGQSGLLDECNVDDDYVRSLRREYKLLQQSHDLEPMDACEWKYLRMRPSNFPPIRIAQLAAIIAAAKGNIVAPFNTTDLKSVLKLLDVEASAYWESHHGLGKPSKSTSRKGVGTTSRRLIIINAIIPFLFAKAHRAGDYERQVAIIDSLSALPREKNSLLDAWEDEGIIPSHEGEAQALIHLYKNYCQRERCQTCPWNKS